MKRFIILLAVAFLAAAPAFGKDDVQLASGKRLDPTLRLILPVHFGVSTLLESKAPATPLYKNFMFNVEMLGVRFSGRGTPFEATIGTRWSFMNFAKDHSTYFGVPVRAAFRFAKRGKVYASVAGEYLVHSSMHCMPWRCSVESGISYGGVGLFASYGLTPFFTTATGPGNTLSFGVVVGL